jgi:GDP-L-fucose synthase
VTDGRTLLVTGGGGMVGRNVVERAAAAGWHVHAPPRRELDLLDAAATRRYVAALAPDAIVHAAGRVGGIQANVADPVGFLVENVDLARNVVLAARDARVPRLLNVASSCMYPADSDRPLREEQLLTGPLEPTNEGYALAKLYATRLCEYVSRQDPACRYRTVIPCNLYGRYDKFDPAVSHLVAAIVRKVHDAREGGAKEVEIWGDGRARREFMYAGDFAEFVVAALARFDSLPDVMNVGIGDDCTIDEYYATVADVIGWRGTFRHDPSRPVGMRRKLTDVARLRAFGWTAPTDLRSGIARTYEYFLEAA